MKFKLGPGTCYQHRQPHKVVVRIKEWRGELDSALSSLTESQCDGITVWFNGWSAGLGSEKPMFQLLLSQRQHGPSKAYSLKILLASKMPPNLNLAGISKYHWAYISPPLKLMV